VDIGGIIISNDKDISSKGFVMKDFVMFVIIVSIASLGMFYLNHARITKEQKLNEGRKKINIESVEMIEKYKEYGLYVFNVKINNKSNVEHNIYLNSFSLKSLNTILLNPYDILFNIDIRDEALLNRIDGSISKRMGSYSLKKGENNFLLIYRMKELKKPFMLNYKINFNLLPGFLSSIPEDKLKKHIVVKKTFK